MPIVLVPEADNQNLVEYTVGKATSSCVYPGIQQCFAIAGIRATHMACAHVSPGSTAQDVADIFESLKEVGGTWASDWYLLGPFAHFFAASTTPWKSVQDIRAAFKQAFGDTGANHWIMDVSGQRNLFGFGIDVKVDFVTGRSAAGFYYKKAFAKHIQTWTALDIKDFNRF
jgi:hypothetical protein